MYRYKEVYSDIKRDILRNHYRAGTLMPTQDELAKKYNISRITLRKSLDLLIDEGLIHTQQGSGTYVRPQLDENSPELLPLDLPIGTTYSHRDQKITSKILFFGARLPSEIEQKNLKVKANEPVYEIKRVRLRDNKIYSYEHTIMPTRIAPLDETILKGTIYGYLGGKMKIFMTDARRVVYAESASKESAQALNVDEGASLLVIEQIAYDQKGEAFEYSKSRFDENHSKFVIDIHRNEFW
ncbi:GntR family transcriptional regulator [Companilactobacillus alimentarius]|uniref:GntR family transcriptional regulator n=1 Tax=Companilactobacillus alimentarius DSM 20249 TaxID=1423720 RepID=A0A2K9HNT5_9LACO|nr:GntR family transcriptional regulator [Companilactobacillus alimentarius]AUI70862.1 GntR family transcriptional regulator [Companilactobacillus alimentarius DSM 20249]GEO44266.1 GntR family transcriptional regulator [Companilactobacillus alimentarius]